MSRRALKRLWRQRRVQSVCTTSQTRCRHAHESASLPHAALVREDRPHFECPRCGFLNDRAPFCLWCFSTNDDAARRWETSKPRPRRVSAPTPSSSCRIIPTPDKSSAPLHRSFSLRSLAHSLQMPSPAVSLAIPANTITTASTTTARAHYTPDTTTRSTFSAVALSPPTLLTDCVTYTSDDDFATSDDDRSRPSNHTSPPSPSPSKYSAYISRQAARRDARILRIATSANAAAVTLEPTVESHSPHSPTRSDHSAAPHPGSIALGHLLPIPGALRVSTTSQASLRSLDLRSVRSRDEIESLYSHNRASLLSRASSRRTGRSARPSLHHHRGNSSQYSIAVLTSNREGTDENEVPPLPPLPGRPKMTCSAQKHHNSRFGEFFRKVGSAIGARTSARAGERPSGHGGVSEARRDYPTASVTPERQTAGRSLVSVKSVWRALTTKRGK